MAERLIHADTDKRIYVTREATEDEPQQERYEWVNPDAPERRIEVLTAQVEAAAALASNANATAQEVAAAMRDGKP